MIRCSAAWLIIGGFAGRANADDALRERFLTEAPKQWQQYRTLASHAQGTGTKTDVHHRDGVETKTEAEAAFAVDGERARVIGKSSRDTTRMCMALNPEYEFRLRAKQPGRWEVVDVETENVSKIPGDLIGESAVGQSDAFGEAMHSTCRGMILHATWSQGR
jgi:hypothetical protein